VTSIPARELRNSYGQIIERVRGGEQIKVLADGIPVVDLVPHVPHPLPPRFRPADDRLAWAPLSAREAAGWATDIRSVSDAVDETSNDPWARG
jgi:antitoxin (DNA-binding transcriptional repressor) of toxin-antitoxin stability system